MLRRVRGAWSRWWLDDLPPLDGRIRLVFYAGLLVLTALHHKSPMLGLAHHAATDPELVAADGLMALLGLRYVPPDALLAVRWATLAAWLCAAAGLWMRGSALATGAGALFLHGALISTNAHNHSWHVPVYALALAPFALAEDRWSLDFHLRRRGLLPRASAPPAGDGFALKLLLVFVVGFYFSSGVSKLLDAGPLWVDGRSLRYALEDRGGRLAALLAGRLWLCSALSAASLALELGSVAALFSRRARPWILLGLCAMHAGIERAMGPWYYANCWTFLLLLDWRAGPLRAVFGGPPRAPRPEVARGSGLRRPAAVAAGTLLMALLAAVALLRIEWWPLATVDMYSDYNGRGLRSGIPKERYRDPHEVQRIAKDCEASGCSRHVLEGLAGRVELRLTAKGRPPLPLWDGVGTSTGKQWRREVLRPVVAADLAAKPLGSPGWAPGPLEHPAARLLRTLAPLVRRHVPGWEGYERAELVYDLGDDAELVLASVPLADVPAGQE